MHFDPPVSDVLALGQIRVHEAKVAGGAPCWAVCLDFAHACAGNTYTARVA